MPTVRHKLATGLVGSPFCISTFQSQPSHLAVVLCMCQDTTLRGQNALAFVYHSDLSIKIPEESTEWLRLALVQARRN